MPLLPNGAFAFGKTQPYEYEASYYLNFHIICALNCLIMLENKNEDICSLFDNESQYYHFYCDHLLFSLGQINERFIVKGDEKSKIKLELIALNRQNYRFNEEDYPILSNKSYRNTIEHIDEHNQRIIAKYKGVGGFNVSSKSSSMNLNDVLITRQKQHPYTLQLDEQRLLIERNKNIRESLALDFEKLKEELNKLKKSVNVVLSCLNDDFLC